MPYGIRSYGQPYFAAVQDGLAFMDGSNGPQENIVGSASVVLDLHFSLEALPVKLASDDEAHILFSYGESGPGGRDMAWIGVSPSGRIMAGITNAPVMQSAPGLLTKGKQRIYVQLDCNQTFPDPPSDALFVHLGDSVFAPRLFTATSANARDRILPGGLGAGPGQFILFNGVQAKTRCACTIYFADMPTSTDEVGNFQTSQWDINEKYGTALAPNPERVALNTHAYTLGLTIRRYAPPAWPRVWGSPSADDISTAFRWYRKTEYARQTRTKTKYVRAA